tara:strand:- start:1130 stop:1555 length:426 start_codon:yes stop_codon:yes gene_type:complete
MFKKMNLQYILSYLGIVPYFLILLDKYIFLQFEEKIIFNFAIYYTLIISVFIGSVNWDLQKELPNYKVIYGFLPSLYAVIIIILNLYSYDINILFFLLILLLAMQLFFDYFLIFKNSTNSQIFFSLRMPLTIFIILTIMLL